MTRLENLDIRLRVASNNMRRLAETLRVEFYEDNHTSGTRNMIEAADRMDEARTALASLVAIESGRTSRWDRLADWFKGLR